MHYFKFYKDELYKVKEVTNFMFFASLPSGFTEDDMEGFVVTNSSELNARASEMIRQARTRRAVVCLYRSDSNLFVKERNYMWNKYANEHQGFCIEYNENTLIGLRKLTDTTVSPESVIVYANIEYGDDVLSVPNINQPNSLSITLGHKTSKWELEKETRLIYRYPNTNTLKGKGIFVPIPMKEKAMCAIYLGCNASKDFYLPLVEFAHQYKIPCFQIQRNCCGKNMELIQI